MALSPAEKQKRYRDRLKSQQHKKRKKPIPQPDEVAPYLAKPFSEFLGEHASNTMFYENLDWVGVQVQGDLEAENHPIDRAGDWADQGTEINSLNRVTAMVGIFIDAAKELSELINRYKMEEIDRQLGAARGARRLRLQQMRKALGKRTSHFFPVIEVKGD